MVVTGGEGGGQWERASLLTFCRMQKVRWEIIANMRRETSGNEEITSQRERREVGKEAGRTDKKISCGTERSSLDPALAAPQSNQSPYSSAAGALLPAPPPSSSTYCTAGVDRCPVATLGTVSKTCRATPISSCWRTTEVGVFNNSPPDSRGCSASDPLTSITPHQRHRLTRRATAAAPTAPTSCGSRGCCG